MDEDHREIEIGQKLAAHLGTLTDRELRAATGLSLPQPSQYEVQRRTANRWRPFADREYNSQKVSYANVPLLIVAYTTRRNGGTPTVNDVQREVIAAGFTPLRGCPWWPRGMTPSAAQLKKMHQWLAGYLMSAEQRGLCRLR